MLPDTTRKVGGYADIERTIALAGENVDARTFWRHPTISGPWVPAFAETTKFTTYNCGYMRQVNLR